jgi:hypothetical protein
LSAIGVILALLAALQGVAGAAVVEPAAVETPDNPWIEPARDVLVQSCGSCHRPELPTSKPRALAVFNLQDPMWYGTMTDDQLRSLGRRIQGASNIEDKDRDIVNMFVNCRLHGACSDARPQESP